VAVNGDDADDSSGLLSQTDPPTAPRHRFPPKVFENAWRVKRVRGAFVTTGDASQHFLLSFQSWLGLHSSSVMTEKSFADTLFSTDRLSAAAVTTARRDLRGDTLRCSRTDDPRLKQFEGAKAHDLEDQVKSKFGDLSKFRFPPRVRALHKVQCVPLPAPCVLALMPCDRWAMTGSPAATRRRSNCCGRLRR